MDGLDAVAVGSVVACCCPPVQQNGRILSQPAREGSKTTAGVSAPSLECILGGTLILFKIFPKMNDVLDSVCK